MKTTIAAHTPTPWEIGHQLGDGFSIVHEIAPNCGELVCLATCHNIGGQAFSGFPLDDETAKANRDLIIRAVNQMAKVDALIQVLEDYEVYRSSILATLQSHGASAVLTSGVLDLVWAYGDKARAALANLNS